MRALWAFWFTLGVMYDSYTYVPYIAKEMWQAFRWEVASWKR